MRAYIGPGRTQAKRTFVATACAKCGSTERLQRHHKDRDSNNNDPLNVEILCQTFHKEDHMRDGTWGRGKVVLATCKICGKEFQPKRTRRATVCSAECLTTLGKISAQKRWAA